MAGEAVPEVPATPQGPVARDPLNPSIVIPVYVGGDGPVPTPPAGDRGDSVVVPAAAPAAVVPPPLPEGTVATAVAADAVVAPAAASPVPAVGEQANVTGDSAPVDTGGKPAEAAVTPPVEGAPVRNEKGQFIPRARFNEVNEERKALKEENDRLKAANPAAAVPGTPAYDFDAKEREHANFVLDGKIDEAVKLRAEIRNAERAEYLKAAEQTTVKTTERVSIKQTIDEVAERVATAVPQFDPESEHYSEDLLSDVRDFYHGALESGRYADPAKAFQASIDKAMKLHGLTMPAPAGTAPAVVAPVAPPAPAAPVAPARTAAKRVEAIVNQPPSLAGVGITGAPESSATLDVKTMTEKDLAALPAATKARLRGDFV